MPGLRTELGEFLLYDPDKSRSTVHVAFAAPTPLEEKTMGRLFFVAEIESHDPQNLDVLHAIQEELTNNYYQSDVFQIETAFETTLQKTNERLQGIIENIEEWLPSFNILIAVVKDTTLHLTTVGRMHAFLVHRQRILDILDTTEGAPAETTSALKIFTNVVSGQLNLNDVLFFCTTSVLDHLSQEKIKRILLEHDPGTATRELETLLGEANGQAAFAGLALRLTPVTQEAPSASSFAVPQRAQREPESDSMRQLISKEQSTHDLLTHSVWPNLGRLAKRGVEKMRRRDRQPMGATDDQFTHDEREAPMNAPPALSRTVRNAQERSVWQAILHGVLQGLAALGRLVWSGLVALVHGLGRLVRNRSAVRQQVSGLPRSTNRSLSHGANWFQRLPVSRRWLLLAVVILIVLFAQSIVSLGNRRDSEQQMEEYRALLTTAREKVQASDAALLIDNESGARRLLNEALAALDGIPADQKELKDDVATVRTEVGTALEAIRHAVAVEPALVYDLSGLDVGLEAGSLTVNDDTLYTFNTRTDTVYAITIADHKSSVVVDAPSLENPLQYFVSGADDILLYQSNGSLQEVNSGDGTLATVAVQYENVDRNVADAFIYNDRLYTLDALNNQIFRHQRAGGNFGLGTAWISDVDVDIRDAKALAIDGSIYVLKNDGTVLKFSGGSVTDDTFDPLDPAVQNPTTLYTNTAVDFVYVLDASQQRVIEYNKDGTFVRQFTSSVFDGGRDLVVQDGIIYVLSNTQVYSFTPPGAT